MHDFPPIAAVLLLLPSPLPSPTTPHQPTPPTSSTVKIGGRLHAKIMKSLDKKKKAAGRTVAVFKTGGTLLHYTQTYTAFYPRPPSLFDTV